MHRMSNNNYIEKDLHKAARIKKWQLVCAPFLGASCVFAFAPFNYWFIAIIIPAILLYFWVNASAKFAFYSGWLYGIGLFASGVSWVFISLHRFGQAPIWLSVLATILFVAILGIFYGIAGYLMRRFLDRNPSITCLCAFPAAFTSVEWLRGWIFTGFPWLTLGYSQTFSPLSAFAPITGVYGLTLILTLIAGALVTLALRVSKRTQIVAGSVLSLIIIICLLSYHELWTVPGNHPTQVSLVQGNIAQNNKWQPGKASKIISTYVQLSQKDWGNRLIVWPEAAIPLIPQQITPIINALTLKAKQTQSSLITGIPLYNSTTGAVYNGALLIGKHPAVYKKRHLVPFGEYFPLKTLFSWAYKLIHIPMSDMRAGPSNQPLFQAQGLLIAPYICYEIAFPSEVVNTMKNANALLVISDDTWFGDSLASPQHLQMAAMRAEETGRFVLFDSNSGPSAVIDPLGQLITKSAKDTATSTNSIILPMYGVTPYMLLGNHLVGLIIVIMLLIIILVRKAEATLDKYQK